MNIYVFMCIEFGKVKMYRRKHARMYVCTFDFANLISHQAVSATQASEIEIEKQKKKQKKTTNI